MDLQFWIYIIVIVITLIARASKKKTQDEQPSVPPAQRPDFENKPMTFDELLKEIQAAKQSAQTQRPHQSVPQPSDYKDYDDEIGEEEQDLEDVRPTYRSDDAIYETYEKAKKEAFSRPSLEETMKLQDTVVRFGQFKGYQQEESTSVAQEVAASFKSPTDFRKAFIMSEILNRKF